MDDFKIGDNEESLNFQDRIEVKQRLRIKYMTNSDYNIWLLTKQQTLDLVRWLDELLLNKEWK